MKLAIISDIHDNLVNLDKALRIIKAEQINTILGCGDVTTIETLEHLRQNFSGEIFLVLGNMEIYTETEVKRVKSINFLGHFGKFVLGNKVIAACHEPFYIEKLLANYKDDDLNIVFYGHTHKPWLEERDFRGKKLKVVNPGTLGGVFQKASFAIYNLDNQELELKVLENINI